MYVAGDILSYKSINIEIQKNIFVVFLLSVLIDLYNYSKIAI